MFSTKLQSYSVTLGWFRKNLISKGTIVYDYLYSMRNNLLTYLGGNKGVFIMIGFSQYFDRPKLFLNKKKNTYNIFF